MKNVKLALNNVKKTYGARKNNAVEVIDGVDLLVQEGEFVCIVGPSGCGKTTLLNMILGLERPSEGVITIDGRPVMGVGNDRACVFQENTLFPWLSVRENIELGLKIKVRRKKGFSKQDRHELTDKYMTAVGLLPYADYRVHELSGGMKQRVSLARALVLETDILLLDEPFAALDVVTKRNMQNELLKIWMDTSKTVVFITHDVEEAILLAQRVVVMGKTPHCVKSVEKIELSYPRDPADCEVLRYISGIKDVLAREGTKEGTE